MIAHRNSIAPTKAERERIERMKMLGCICCYMFGLWVHPEVHHIVVGNKRLGHWYTIPLCPGHHRGAWGVLYAGQRIALSDGSKRFTEAFGTERELWKKVQDKLGLPYVWPSSKVLPRAVA